MTSQNTELALEQTDAPASLHNGSSKDNMYKQCLSCKIMGGATFVGLGIYTMTIPLEPIKPTLPPWRQALQRFAPHTRGAFGLGFMALGIYRLIS